MAASVPVDWKARGRREAAAILNDAHIPLATLDRNTVLSLLAIAWIQGVTLGMHETLSEVEQGFEKMRAEL